MMGSGPDAQTPQNLNANLSAVKAHRKFEREVAQHLSIRPFSIDTLNTKTPLIRQPYTQ